MYATLDFSCHPLSESTLLNNCGATHLVNSKEMLEPRTFVKAALNECVDAGTQSLPILGRGTRVLRNILYRSRGRRIEDLQLSDVVVVEGFHVNIVSEARLRDAGVWYHGLDCSLRNGNDRDNVVLAELKRMYNLVFIEYKPLSTYLDVLSEIPTSASILMFPTIKRALHRKFRRSRDFLKPREDSAEVWHKRAGHLGPGALEQLVLNARNVKIKGIL